MRVNLTGRHAVRLTTTFLLISLVGSAALEILIGLDVMEIGVWDDEGDYGDWQHRDGRIVNTL